jgi:uncharacterized coiled-coil DUF342 family protein
VSLESAWIPLIGALFGGIGLKLLEHWLGRSKMRLDEASKIRDELRVEITGLREESKVLEKEANEWKEKYYDLREKYTDLNTQLTLALQKVKDEAPRP